MGLFDDVLGGDSQGQQSTSGLFDDVIGKPKKQNKGIAGDLVTDLKRGVEQLPGIATGLADIPVAAITGKALVGDAADALGGITGFAPAKWAKEAEAEYSPGRQAARQNVGQAWDQNKTPFSDAAGGDFSGLGNIAKAYIQNPQQLVGSVVESLPSMAVGAKGGQMLTKAAGLAAPVLSASVGEGAVMAGQQMDQLSQTDADPRAAAAASALTGIAGGAIGGLGGKLAQKMGVIDPDVAMAGGALRGVTDEAKDKTIKGMVKDGAKRVAGGAVSEGAFEELPQSVLEQVLSNLAQSKPWDEGVSRAAVEGTLAGSLMGGAFNALPGKQAPEVPPPPAGEDKPEIAGPLSAAANLAVQSGAHAATVAQQAAAQAAENTTPEGKAGTPAGAQSKAAAPASDGFQVGQTWRKGKQSYTIDSVSEDGKMGVANFGDGKPYSVHLDAEKANGWTAEAPASQSQGPLTSIAAQAPTPAPAADPNIVEKRAQSYYAAGNAKIDEGFKEEGLHLMAQGDAILRGEQPKPFVPGATTGGTANVAAPAQAAPQADQGNAPKAGGAQPTAAPQAGQAQAGQFDLSNRTETQLTWLTTHGQNGFKEAAVAELQKRGKPVAAQQPADSASTVAQNAANSAKTDDATTSKSSVKESSRESRDDGSKSIRYDIGTSGFATVLVTPDGKANLYNIQIGEENSTERSKGQGTKAYEEIGKALAKEGITLESTRWSKHTSSISPAALRVWEKLEAAGLARRTGQEEGKVLDRFSSLEEVRSIPTYEFVAGNQEQFNNETPATDVTITNEGETKQAPEPKPEKPAPKSPTAGGPEDSIGWSRMTNSQRESLLHRAGYTGKNGKLNLGGAGILKRAWDGMGKSVREKLIAADAAQFEKPIDQNQIKNETPAAATVPDETKAPEQEPTQEKPATAAEENQNNATKEPWQMTETDKAQDAKPKQAAKPRRGAIGSADASRILSSIYQRAAYNKWSWERLKSYLTREVEEANGSKTLLQSALERAMTEYARNANGRLGYPNSSLVYSMMRNYGLIIEESNEESQPVAAEPAAMVNVEKRAETPKAESKPKAEQEAESHMPSAEDIAEQLRRFENGDFAEPSSAAANLAGGNGAKDAAKEYNDYRKAVYAAAAKQFLEGKLDAKVPSGKNAKYIAIEGLNNVSPQPRGRLIPKVKTDLSKIIKALHRIAADGDIRYYLNGIHVEKDDKRLVATDGHRAAVIEGVDLSALPPMEKGKTVLNRYFGEKNGSGDAAAPHIRWIDGRFPDWQRIMPPNHSGTPELFNAERVGNYVRGVVKASSYTELHKWPVIDINIGDFRMSFNAQYIADAADLFRAFGYDTFLVSAKESTSSLLMTSPDNKVRQVIMPMRGARDVGQEPMFAALSADGKAVEQKPEAQPAQREGQDKRPADSAENIAIGRAAIDRVIATKSDEKHAMYRPDHGWVSFVWGKEGNPERKFAGGHGIAKIIAKRTSEGANGEAVARKMVEVIALGAASENYGPLGGERFNVTHDGHTAVLSLHRFGKEETWLLTGWDDVESDGAEAGNASGTYAPESSGIRTQEGADGQSVANQPAEDKPAKYSGPADVSSRAGQMELANRAGTIAALKAMNEQLRKIAPDEAWNDSNIENAQNLDALRDQISQALVDANRGKPEANPLRKELEELSGQELKDVFNKLNLAGKMMAYEERISALLMEDAAEVRAAIAKVTGKQAEDKPAAVDTETKPKSANLKSDKPPKTETTGDMHQSLKKAGYERGTLPMNNREIRVGLNMDAPFSDQRFEAVINRRGDKWVISEVETPELKSEGMIEAMAKFRADLALLNEGKWPAAEPATVDAKNEAEAKPESANTPEQIAESLDAEKIKNGYKHRALGGLSDKVQMERNWFSDALKKIRDYLAPLARNDEQKEKLDELMAKFADDYKSRRYRVMEVGESSYSSAVAGRSNFNNRQAQQRGNALTKAEESFNQWLESAPEGIKAEILRLRTEDERSADAADAEATRVKALVKPVIRDLAMIGAIDSGEAPGMSRSAFTNGAVRKVANLHNGGETAALEKVFTEIAKWDEKHDKPLFTDRSPIWQYKPTAAETTAAAPAEAGSAPKPFNTVDAIETAIEGLYDGTLSLDDYKAAFRGLMANKEAIVAELGKLTKDQLLRRVGKKMYGGSETKPELVTRTFEAIREAFSLRRSYGRNSWTMGPGQYEKYQADNLAALTELVNSSTAEDLKAFADEIGKTRAARQEKIEAAKDPKTIEDFENAIRLKRAEGLDFNSARMSLAPAQRAEFDRLRGTESRDQRKARADQQKSDVRVAAQMTDGQVVETKHTKTGEPLFVVKAAERVDRDVYSLWNATAKRMGGYYSSFRGNGAVPGFQFKTRENADAFLAFIGGNAEAAKEVVQERRDAFADDNSQSAVERLNEMADRMEERADESLGRERKANTERRARFAASAESAANAEKAMAKTMRRIADAISNGTAQFLDRVRQKAQIEYLASALRTAKYKEVQVTHPNDWDRNQRYNEPATAETADYAEFPQYAMMRSDLANLARKLVTLPNMKMLGQRILKAADDTSEAYNKFAKENLLAVSRFGKADGSGFATFSTVKDAERSIEISNLGAVAVPLQIKRGEYRIVLSPSEAINRGIWQGDDRKITLAPDIGAEIVEKLGRLNRKYGGRRGMDAPPESPWQFENAYNDRKRLAGMGIEQPWEFRAALREFAGLKEAPKERDKIKEMERAMIGRKNDGLDFFPTPSDTARAMIDAAELTDGMAVLEPSAGMGHIAEQIREAGVDPDVIEFNSDRRELLEAKGFNVVGSDFMDMTPRGFTFGDVFRDKDGVEGIMRGSGGMGSGRVGFIPLGKDERQSEWRDRDELEGVRKNGTNSGYDRIIMNPPFSNRRDAEHVQHAYTLLRPGGRLVAIMGEGVFFGQDKRAQQFRDWLEEVGGTSEKLAEGTFLDPSLPVNTATNARMVVVDKPAGQVAPTDNEGAGNIVAPGSMSPADKAIYGMAAEGKSAADILKFIATASRNPFYRQLAKLLMNTGIAPSITVGDGKNWKMSAGDGYKYAAAYNPKSNTVALFRAASAERNILHEMMHAATIKALAGKGMAAAQMQALYNHVKKTGKLAGMYGMTDIDEFVAEAFSNPKFQDRLKAIAAPQASAGWLSNAWNWFVRVVRGILGLPSGQENALSQALEIGIGVMREDMKLRNSDVAVPFAVISGAEIDKTLGRNLQEKATNWMRANLQGKSFRNDATGWDISVGRKGINKAISHGAKEIHARSVAAIPSLLKNAILAASETNKMAKDKMDVFRVHHFYAPLLVGGDTYVARLVVKETRSGQKFYDYDTSDEISPAKPDADAHLPKEGAAAGNAGRAMSIATLRSYVKAEHGGTDPRFAAGNIGGSAVDQTKTPEFKRWFGDSKVVDADGKPLVVYHGTAGNFSEFNTDEGAHFGTAPAANERAGMFMRGNVMPVYLSIRNPKRVQDQSNVKAGEWGDAIEQAKAEGYDGLVYRNDVEDSGGDSYVVFDPTQIKSAIGNNGNFDGANPDIRYNANEAHGESYGLSEERKGNRSLYGSELEALRRAAARLEDPERGVTFRVTQDGQAIVTGPARFNIPERFKRFAEKHGLTLRAERGSARPHPNGAPERTRIGAMPEDYRGSGALYAQEMGANTDRTDRVRFNVADEGWSVSEPSKMDSVIYALQDKHIDTKRVIQAIAGAGRAIRDAFNPYLQEELFHGRAAKGVKDFLDFELRPLLKQMQDAKIDMGDFEEYLWNRHAEERNRQIAKVNPDMPDGGSGISTAEARAYLAGLSADQRRTFEDLAAKVEAINRNSQAILVGSGLEKQSTIDAWNNAYQHYVPLQREDVDNGHVGTGKGFSVRGSSTKRAMGSGRKVVDILANITMQRERNIVRAEKNRVSNALAGLVAENPNPDFWKLDKAPKERVVEEVAIYTVLDDQGRKVEEFTSMDEAERFARSVPGSDIEQTWGDRVKERVVPGFKNRDNVLLTRINGDDHFIVFNERDERAMRMVTALKNLDVDNLGRVLSVVGKATRYLASINTQYNPVFGVINLIRDAQGALINLSSTPLAGEQKRVLGYTKDALVGIYRDIRAHRAGLVPSSNWAALFEEFQKEGGQTGYRDQYANAETRSEAIKSELAQFKEGKAKQLTRGLFGWLSDYNETMENAVRLAAYKAAKEKGMSKQQAASLAKNITVNFNRKGQMATQVGALYAFFNASVQGTARIAETLFEQHGGDIKNVRLSKTGKKIVIGGIMLGSMQALLLAAAGYDDDEPPEFVRERNMILPIGDGKYLTLAMPLGFHVLPGIGRIATEFVMSGGKDPIKKLASFGSMFAEALNPVGNSGFSLQTIAPSVVDPFAALAENRDFTGREIFRENFNSLNPQPGHARAKDIATIWSRLFSHGLNFISGGSDYRPGLISWSPDAIDYLIGQASGGVGRELGKAAQTGESMITGEELPLHKVPLFGRFVGDTQGSTGQSQKFYDSIRKVNMLEAEYKGLLKDGQRAEATAFLSENPGVRLILAGNAAENQVKKLRAMRRDLIERDAGRDSIRAVEERITETMRKFDERAGALI